MNTRKFLLIVLVFSLFHISRFAYAQLNTYKNTEISIEDIESLLDKRRIILNDAFFNNLKLDKISEKLILIEKEPILKEDINFISVLKENPTDLAYVHSLSISNIEKIKKVEGSHEYDVICTISWAIKYGTEENVEKCLYRICLQNQSGSLYLKKLQPVIDN